MDVSRTRALRGPNLWSRHMAIEAVVTCAETGGGDVSLAHVLQTAALALQAQAGCPVTFARTTATTDAGVYQVVVEYSEEAVGRKAFENAQQLIKAAQGEGNFDADTVIAELRELDEDERLGPSTGSIVDAAVARGIPYRRLTRGSLVQFGWGSKQRRIRIHRPGQGPDQTPAACRGRARAAGQAGRERGRSLGSGPQGRPARGGQATGWQPGQGWGGQQHGPRPARRSLQERRR